MTLLDDINYQKTTMKCNCRLLCSAEIIAKRIKEFEAKSIDCPNRPASKTEVEMAKRLCDYQDEVYKLKKRIKELEDFLKHLDMCEIRGESVLILKPTNIIFKDIRPKPTFSDSVIMLTCATHSTPELFLKIIKTILN